MLEILIWVAHRSHKIPKYSQSCTRTIHFGIGCQSQHAAAVDLTPNRKPCREKENGNRQKITALSTAPKGKCAQGVLACVGGYFAQCWPLIGQTPSANLSVLARKGSMLPLHMHAAVVSSSSLVSPLQVGRLDWKAALEVAVDQVAR